MSRVSHSLLDPYVTTPLKKYYPSLPIPKSFPPEGLIAAGHLMALLGGVGFAYSTTTWWGGLLAAVGVWGNHFADIFDGTHARATGQCRHGGELLDHFTDPLSFTYWIVGMSVAIGHIELGLAGVVVLYATALLTSIKAKITGKFELATFGPTEFKMMLIAWGVSHAVLQYFSVELLSTIAFGGYSVLLVLGFIQLLSGLILGVREVNSCSTQIDQEEWVVTRESTEGMTEESSRE
ncbi:MAG: CDP-alcohol phosphatidyltransferase family protein [Planctomycetaceae bacterium]|nr:CDP-alcohol phosphatidyltransferase family protein [Planctomycetaceae bacterium]MCB9951302.1 CDP-alcohol phosphatidyltransferase family protein [Planctomycetaceae bacterium]